VLNRRVHGPMFRGHVQVVFQMILEDFQGRERVLKHAGPGAVGERWLECWQPLLGVGRE
jgi:hypothetical protein